MSRLNEIILPEEKDEIISVIQESIFGPVKTFRQDGFSLITPEHDIISHTYAIIDAMYWSDVSIFLDAFDTEYECLWKGDSEAQFAFYAPYIVKLVLHSGFSNFLFDKKQGSDWGIFVRSHYSLSEVAHHFRKFNQIYDEVNHNWIMFRYYSTIAIKDILPALPAPDFAQFFSGIDQIVSDGANGKLLVI